MSNGGWRESTERTLNRDEVMKVRRLGGCENFVVKWEELVFDEFVDSEPVESA